jgi:hypothetical protein
MVDERVYNKSRGLLVNLLQGKTNMEHHFAYPKVTPVQRAHMAHPTAEYGQPIPVEEQEAVLAAHRGENLGMTLETTPVTSTEQFAGRLATAGAEDLAA